MSEQDLQVVRKWMDYEGDLPTDEQFGNALHMLLVAWCEQRHDGMDTVAGGFREQMIEILEAIGDI